MLPLKSLSVKYWEILYDAWVLKVDTNGDIDWQKTVGGNDSNSANFIRQISGGRYIVAGEISYFGAGNSDVCLLKLESNGNNSGESALIHTSYATVSPAAPAAFSTS